MSLCILFHRHFHYRIHSVLKLFKFPEFMLFHMLTHSLSLSLSLSESSRKDLGRFMSHAGRLHCSENQNTGILLLGDSERANLPHHLYSMRMM